MNLQQLRSRLARKRLAVLMGGNSAERAISLRSGQKVLEALQGLGLTAWGADVRTWQDLTALKARRPDAAVLCLHGTGGEDGSIQGALEWLGIPYTGSGILASSLAMDKARSKEIFRAQGLPTPAWALLSDPRQVLPKLPGLPVVVKPNRQGSTVGITIVRAASGLRPALRVAWRHDSQVLVEKFCPGREITVGILEEQALPVIEIVPKNGFYDYESKYTPGMSEHIIPARLPEAWQARAQKLSLAAHRSLGCRGVSRVDLIVDARGAMNILEVNTIPGMTGTSLLPDAARHAGIAFGELVMRLAVIALEGR